MRNELNDASLEKVTGGEVVMSESLGVCGFNTTGEVFRIKGNFKDMRDRLLALYDDNCDMSDADFDQLVKNDFKSRGWI